MGTKKRIQQLERVGLAALNLLIASGIVNGDLVHVMVGAGRLDELADWMEKLSP